MATTTVEERAAAVDCGCLDGKVPLSFTTILY